MKKSIQDKEHFQKCEAPICQGDKNPNYKYEVVWFAGEPICQKTPYQKFQKKQVDINKWVAKGVFKNVEQGYTAHQLETKSI